MNTTSSNSMRNLCRTCMIQFSETSMENAINKRQCIYEVPSGCNKDASIMELLQWVQPQIKVERNDDLPTQICSNCIHKLLVSHEFIETYRNADTKFRKMLKESNSFKGFEESLKTFKDVDRVKEALDNEPIIDVNEITKNEYEIQEIVIKNVKKKEENQIDYPELEDEMSDETADPMFERFYSDSSDSEWTPGESSQQDLFNRISQKQKRAIPPKIMVDEKELIQLPEGNEDGRVPCKECDAVLDNVKLWQEHMRQHRLGNIPQTKFPTKTKKPRGRIIPKNFKCEHCGKALASSVTYKNHMRIHTGVQNYLCIECGKNFIGLSSLKVHMLRHKGEKNFQCQHCPKKFVSSAGLYRHEILHSNEKPYVCDICGAAFHMAYQLKNHDLNHKGIKNFKCEYCDMKFLNDEKRRRHTRTHTGEKPYRCKYCDRAFTQSNDHVKHVRLHLGVDFYQCELCPQRFALVRDLRAHFATHKDDDEETRARNLQAREEEQRSLKIKLVV